MTASGRPDHQVRAGYSTLAAMLTDLSLCAGDIRHLADAGGTVDSTDLEFLARRLQRLARGARNALPVDDEQGRAG